MVVWPRPISSFVVGRCPPTVERRSGPRTAVPAIAPDCHLVHGDLRADALCYSGDSAVVFNAPQDHRIRGATGRVREVQLERIAIEPGRRRQMRETGPEHRCSTQRRDGEHRSEKCTAHGNRRPAGPSLQGVPDADHGARRCAHRREVRHRRRGAGRTGPALGANGRCGTEYGPRTENEHGHHSCQRPEQQDPRVKRDAGRTFGNPRLTERGERREQGGYRHSSRSADEPHHEVLCHAEGDQLAAICPESGHSGVVPTLDDALTSQCLAYHRQSDESGESSQDPPPDGLRVDGGFNRNSSRILV